MSPFSSAYDGDLDPAEQHANRSQGPVMGLVVPADEHQRLAHETLFPGLGVLQELVGGYIEAVYGDGWLLFCNEQGLLDGLAINVRATRLARALGWSTGDLLCGQVVFFGTDYLDADVPAYVLDTARTLGYLP